MMEEERRRDPADGAMYTQAEFIACYGTTKQWDAAAPPSSKVSNGPPPVSPPAFCRGQKVETVAMSKPELNGLKGDVVRLQGERVVVSLPAPHGEKALRPQNLSIISGGKKPSDSTDGVPAAKRQRVQLPTFLEGQPEIEFWGGITASHKCLMVGDVNFSLSNALARRIGNAEGLVCTDASVGLSSRDGCTQHMLPLLEMGATLCTRVDATRLGKHALVRRCGQYFDYVIWGFPLANCPGPGPKSDEERLQMLKRFLQQAELVLAKGGFCSITVSDAGPFGGVEVHNITQGRLQFIGAESFSAAKFPQFIPYPTRTGAPQQHAIYPALTYVFALQDA
eukprot:TRINITY_DN55038_c0_g1_i1.p1 TRINITY_DN55038_c0_g1~~TRINITY_DN55038_c0_g1_i1.p1  ORF type:complete len:372 (+),score=102.55 TRINITY_DN55038_c0_g1_i1:107-1117(+)